MLPCARCRRLGVDCTRELVKIKSSVTQHAAEVAFLESITSDLEALSLQDELRPVIQRMKDRTAKLQYGDDPIPATQPQDEAALGTPVNQVQQQGHSSAENLDLSILTTLEHLAWGRGSGKCYPHRGCGCQYDTEISLRPLPASGSSTQIVSNVATIVTLDVAKKLVHFHVGHLVWHHNCMHSPTFLRQCNVFWETGQCIHPLWRALYLSVLSATIYAISSSPRSKAIFDAELDIDLPSAHEIFTVMMDTLWAGEFLRNATIHSVQAIAICTEVAHNLGQSQLNATLLSVAIRIAETLGLHTIQDAHVESLNWEVRMEREVGKRVWCQLIIQDHFAIPFTDSYIISPIHYSTSSPSNMDDDDLAELASHLPTVSSYVRVLLEMADLMPDLYDGLGPMKERKSPREQYEHLLRIDARMRAAVRGFPVFLLRQDIQHEERLPWLGTARRSLAITAAEKIIMIHR